MSESIFFTPGKKKARMRFTGLTFQLYYISLYITPIIWEQVSSTHRDSLFFF